MKRALLGLTSWLALGACADRNVGQPIPADQLYFPTAVATLGDASAGRLAVLSSNFDQRYQSQQISILDADQLIQRALLGLGVPTTGEGACSSPARPFFSESLGDPAVAPTRVRLPGVGGELLVVPGQNTGDFDLYTTNRLNSVIIRVMIEGGGAPRCAREAQLAARDQPEIIANTDCSDNFVIASGAEDPFSLARGQDPMGNGYIAVGHLFGYITGFSQFGVVTFLDEARLRMREFQALDPDVDDQTFTATAASFALQGTAGLSGLAYSGLRDELLVTSLRFAPRIELAGLELVPPGEATTDANTQFVALQTQSVRFDGLTNAVGTRGVTLTPDGRRAIVSLRFNEPGVTSNAGLAVVLLDDENFVSFPALEVGEELGPAALRPQANGEPLLAYFGDLLTDKIYIVDVTRDLPRVVGEILGRSPRVLPGRDEPISAHTLDGPQSIAFVRRGERTYGFVANFANSTLTLLDVSDPLPQRHCILARFGQDVDANGETEAQTQP